MKKTLLSIALASTLASGYALAEQPSYNYIEGGFASQEDADGIVLRGSVELTDLVYGTGSFTTLSDDETNPGIDVDTESFSLGLGVKQGVTDNVSVYGEARYLDSEVEIGNLESSDDGYSLAAGVRAMVADQTEVYSELAHIKFDDASTEVTIGARQYFTDNIGVFAEYKRNDFEVDGYNVGISAKF